MKRFWRDVSVATGATGFSVRLDGRPIMTPLRHELAVPTARLAGAVKVEWEAVQEMLDPAKMPMTGFANVAIDRIGPERATFNNNIVAYGESDLFCYRADEQEHLATRQAEIWDPWIDWTQSYYDVRFVIVAGIMHRPQPAQTLARLEQAVVARSDFEIAAMAKLAHLSGSLIVTLALMENVAEAEKIWDATCLDEDWQAEQWGADEFAMRHRHDRKAEFLDAARFLRLLG